MAATDELWRVAEAGDADELSAILLRGADVNARNKHGMTALMRAAYHGHEEMVRALLKHGADPNLSRNDKFTALALAAFFGHTGTVRILIEHGAKTEVITRCGASAQTWAIARTFQEVARCLNSPVPAVASARAPAPAPVAVTAPVIKTLKDPPEIWDLVHEAPRGFNAGSAFISRLTSMKVNLAFRIAAVALVSAAFVVGVLVLRGSQARSLPVEASANQSVVGNEAGVSLTVEKGDSTRAVAPSAPETAEFSHHAEAPVQPEKSLRKVTSMTRQTRLRSTEDEEPIQTVQSKEVPAPPAPVTVAKPQVEPRKTNKPSTLSPQLISPTTSSQKAKVIQWP